MAELGEGYGPPQHRVHGLALRPPQQGRLVPERRVPEFTGQQPVCLLLPSHRTPFLSACQGSPHPPGVGKARAEEAAKQCGFRASLPKCKPNSPAAARSLGFPGGTKSSRTVPALPPWRAAAGERVRVGRSWALVWRPLLLRARAPPAGPGQTSSQVPTPSLWRGQASGRGGGLTLQGPSAGQAPLKAACIQWQRREAFQERDARPAERPEQPGREF